MRRHTAFLAINDLFNSDYKDIDRIDQACFKAKQQSSTKADAVKNIADAQCGAALFETPLSDGKEHSAKLLIDSARQGGYWQAKQSDQNCVPSAVNRCPLRIEINLCGGDSIRNIREVRLSGQNIPEKSMLPTDVRVYAWRSPNETLLISEGYVDARTGLLTIHANVPRLARRVLLEIYPERPNQAIALERVEVFE